MMISEITITGDPAVFKNRVLKFTGAFRDSAFLDSHTGKTGPVPITGIRYDFLAAAGSLDTLILEREDPETPSSGSEYRENSLLRLQRFIGKHQSAGNWVFGFLSYDMKNHLEKLNTSGPDHTGFPLFHFFAAEHVIIANGNRITVRSGADPYRVWEQVLAQEEPGDVPPPIPPVISHVLDRSKYNESYDKLIYHIQQGDIYEVNFCHEVLAAARQLDPLSVYCRLTRISPSPFSCYYRTGDRYLLCSSPERFISRRQTTLLSQPIKGTAGRSADMKTDEQLRNGLRQNEKERSENIMIVDLVRNDLSRVAVPGSVRVDELCGVYAYPRVHQMISTISCRIPEALTFVEIIQALFPMGSMTGAPKISAMNLIDATETFSRSLFSGTVGYISPGNDFDFNVVIRSILYNASTGVLSLAAGGAITAASNREAEYRETLLKLAPQLEALGLTPEQLEHFHNEKSQGTVC